AGQVAHQPTTPTLRPASEAISQSARTFRIPLVTGRAAPVFGLTATKWLMPWASGVLPVAIVVQSTGLISSSPLPPSRPDAPPPQRPEMGKLAPGRQQRDRIRVQPVQAKDDGAFAAATAAAGGGHEAEQAHTQAASHRANDTTGAGPVVSRRQRAYSVPRKT